MNQPDLLLLHGALGAGEQFDALLPLLGGIGRIHTLDFEGHGRADPKSRPFAADYFVENILEYMDEKALTVVDIFGYSMGGHIGLYLARKHPERVRRIFTFATKFNWTMESAAREAAYLDPERIMHKAPAFARALEARHTRSDWKNVLAKTKEMILHQGRENFLTEADLGKITKATRLSLGDRDKMVSFEETIDAYQLLPNAQLQIFPGTAHPIEHVSAKMLAEAMLSFFCLGRYACADKHR
jgi:pimeloyl-ACP methyl ester carboxylesterase